MKWDCVEAVAKVLYRKKVLDGDRVREIIEDVSPGPFLELFARNQTKGWTSWGNEVPKLRAYKRAS